MASKKGGCKQSVNTVPSGSPQLYVTRFNLSPGASLTPLVEGQEALIFGMGDGELVNEKKSPPAHVNVRNGSMVLMPREQHYLLRNIGKQELDVLVVQVRR